MSDRYVEASAKDVTTGVEIEVVIERKVRSVELSHLRYAIRTGLCVDAIRDEFLADIVVRGIRSLEEERATKAKGFRGELDIDYDYYDRKHDLGRVVETGDLDELGRTAVGHGAG